MIFFFFNDTATTEIYTLSLHDALPISPEARATFEKGFQIVREGDPVSMSTPDAKSAAADLARSEEHTSELQSRLHLVCRLLLEKKKQKQHIRCCNLRCTQRLDCSHLAN